MNPDHSNPSQASQILDHLRSNHPLTQREALRLYGCMRLGARIWELNQTGAGIQKRMVYVPGRNGRARVAEYFIPQPEPTTTHENEVTV